MCPPLCRYRVYVTLANGESTVIESEAILNGTGRSPNVHDLGLEAAGVAFDARAGVSSVQCGVFVIVYVCVCVCVCVCVFW